LIVEKYEKIIHDGENEKMVIHVTQVNESIYLQCLIGRMLLISGEKLIEWEMNMKNDNLFLGDSLMIF
jgi:hypothetical protein